MRERPETFLPLSTASFHVLLALAGGELHGYGIMLEVSRQSQGQYKLGPGTLYDNLRKLMSQCIVEESRNAHSPADPRRFYRLTGLGRRVLAAEVSRLEGMLREAKGLLRAPKLRRVW